MALQTDTSLLDRAAHERQARNAADRALREAATASELADRGEDPVPHMVLAHIAAAEAHEAAALADTDEASSAAEDASNAADPDMDDTDHGRDHSGAPARAPDAHRRAAEEHRMASVPPGRPDAD